MKTELMPMGALTYAIACSHCKNRDSSLCKDCRCEVTSGFELDPDTLPKWIPVSERLPDKWRETDEKYFGEPIEFIVHIAGAECATTLCFDGKDFFDINTGEIYMVTHWMPLPEPPKEE